MRQNLTLAFDRPVRSIAIPRVGTAAQDHSAAAERLAGVRERMQREDATQRALADTVGELRRALNQVSARVDENLQSVTALATELGLAIAKEVVGEGVADGLLDPSSVVLRCLRDGVLGGSRPDIRIELCPEDLNMVVSALGSHPDLASEMGQLEFVANPALGRSCVEVTTESGRLSYDPEEVLRRICDEVRKEACGGSGA